MNQSSSASIPPLSRAPSPSWSEASVAAQQIWARFAQTGAVLSLLLSVVSLWSPPGGAQIPSLALVYSIFVSAILAGLLLSAVGVLSWATCTAIPSLNRFARVIASSLATLVALAYLAVRGTAEAFRITSGSPLDLGTLEFVRGGFGHLAWPIVTEYALLSGGLLLSTAMVGAVTYLFLARDVGDQLAGMGLFSRGAASLLGLAILVHTFSTPGIPLDRGVHRTAELSFLSSVAAREEERIEMQAQALRVGIHIPRGAPLSNGDLWTDAVARTEGPRPNVLLIMMESVGMERLGYFGYGRPVTPHLDAISAKSLRFRQARATASHSNYAQMAVLSSLFPRRYTGLDTYGRLDYPRVLWHDFLTALNYKTATFSSQDETWQGMLKFQTTGTHTEMHHARNYEGEHLQMGAEQVVPDQVTARRAIEWIGKAQGPWGLYVNFQSTHFPYKIPLDAPAPYQPTRPTQGKYHYLNYPESDTPVVNNRYDNALGYVDHQIGRLYKFLEESGRLDNTIVVITSDHGELFWDHGKVTHGRTLYDKEVRVPLLVHYPKQLPPEDRLHAVSTLDVLPTLADLLEIPPHPAFQGRSLLAHAPDMDRPTFMNIQGMKAQDSVVCGDFKFVNDNSGKKQYLFNLRTDPGESRNLVTERPTAAENLKLLLGAQMRAQMDYHSGKDSEEREAYFAPRFASCPKLEESMGASAALRSDVPAALSSN